MTQYRFPSVQKALVFACARAAEIKRARAELDEWERRKAQAEADLEDAPTLTRLSPEVTAVVRMRERVYLAGARRRMSAYEQHALGRRHA